MAYTNKNALLAEAKRLAEQAINVSDEAKKQEVNGKKVYPDYSTYEICSRRHWIKYYLQGYLVENPDKRNKPLILK